MTAGWAPIFVSSALVLPLDMWACTRRGSRTLAAKLHELPAVLWFADTDPESVRGVAWLSLPINIGVVAVSGWMTITQAMP